MYLVDIFSFYERTVVKTYILFDRIILYWTLLFNFNDNVLKSGLKSLLIIITFYFWINLSVLTVEVIKVVTICIHFSSAYSLESHLTYSCSIQYSIYGPLFPNSIVDYSKYMYYITHLNDTCYNSSTSSGIIPKIVLNIVHINTSDPE